MSHKKAKRPETGGLQEKKVVVELTPEEIKANKKADKAKRAEKRAERRAGRIGFFQRIKDVIGELKKVNWPTWAHTVKQTGVVLGVVLVFALVVFGIDSGLGAIFDNLTKGLK